MDKVSFDIDLSEFESGVKIEINDLASNIAEEMFRKIVDRTPVKSGYAKSRWQVEVDKDSDGFVNAEITNDAPYIIFLEMGSSDQAPNGMVAITLAEMEMKYS